MPQIQSELGCSWYVGRYPLSHAELCFNHKPHEALVRGEDSVS